MTKRLCHFGSTHLPAKALMRTADGPLAPGSHVQAPWRSLSTHVRQSLHIFALHINTSRILHRLNQIPKFLLALCESIRRILPVSCRPADRDQLNSPLTHSCVQCSFQLHKMFPMGGFKRVTSPFLGGFSNQIAHRPTPPENDFHCVSRLVHSIPAFSVLQH